MRHLFLILLLSALIALTLQQSVDKEKGIEKISDGLVKLRDKITKEFNKFKEQIKKLFTERDIRENREKRQIISVDPSLATLAAAGFINNIGFLSGLQSSANARVIDRVSNAALQVGQKIATDASGFQQQGGAVNQRISNLQAPPELCPFKKVAPCDPKTRHRRFDGSCNNLQNPWWGKSEIPYKRYLPAEYSDGFQQPRMFAKSKRFLPNARLISRKLCVNNDASEVLYSHILGAFGQFLAHDMTSVSISTDDTGAVIDCPCGSTNPSCFSIPVPMEDGLMKSTCIRLTRSSSAFPTIDCRLGVREQLNIISSFVDGSPIYGIDHDKSVELRAFVGGLLKSSPGSNNRPFMLKGVDGACRDTNTKVKCFIGGEGRTNENLGLLSIQTLFLRMHNKLANQLASLNRHWNDELIYHETRRIIIAMIQHITYSEYLPMVVGVNTAARFDLLPLDNNTYYTGYDQNVNPSMANEFTTAAFRFGHSMIRNQYSRADQSNKKFAKVNLGEMIFRPVEAYNEQAGGLESILIGLLNDQSAKYDTNFADTLQNHLFEFKLSDGSSVAVDLAATNINRGRDHGIPSYNAYRERCGLKRALKFDDLSDTMNATQIQKLASVYESPDDIDLFIGGLSENPLFGAIVGPVFGCLIGNQFSDLKKGDRFFYEHGPSQTSFTLDQLAEIRNVTLASLICECTDIREIQPFAFFMASDKIRNTRVRCDKLRKVDLKSWLVLP